MSLKSRLITTKCFKERDVDILLNILRSTDNAIIVIDYKDTVVYINRFCAERVRIKPEKLLSRSLYDIEPRAKLIRVMKEGRDQEENKVEYIKSLKMDSVGLVFPLYNQKKEKMGTCTIFKGVTQVVELTRRLQKAKEMVQYLTSQLEASKLPISFQSYISLNKELKKTLSLTVKVANTNCTILVQGESGVSKEVMAKCIHSANNRGEQPMVKVNCASIPENLLEGELFGYKERAFTGTREGGKLRKFELTNKGTILLDEVDDISPTMQSKLLRILQKKELKRVGGTKTIKLDMRAIAATSRNPEEMVEKNEFRSDLYCRLHVVPTHIPPLRSHRKNIMPLVRYFIARDGGGESTDLAPGSIRVLEKYDWLGNVGELRNVTGYAVIVKTGSMLEIKGFLQYLRGNECPDEQGDECPRRLKGAMKRLEKSMIKNSLRRNNENKSMVISELGLSRRSFYEKVEKYGLK